MIGLAIVKGVAFLSTGMFILQYIYNQYRTLKGLWQKMMAILLILAGMLVVYYSFEDSIRLSYIALIYDNSVIIILRT